MSFYTRIIRPVLFRFAPEPVHHLTFSILKIFKPVLFIFNFSGRNKTAPVKKETAKRIKTAIEELHYVPHRAAKALRTGKTKMIGFTVDLPNLKHPATMELIYKIEEV